MPVNKTLTADHLLASHHHHHHHIPTSLHSTILLTSQTNVTMSDPVADKSGFLCMYMSSHPDTLVSYAKHFGHISESLLSAKMESIDSKGMNLSYVTKKDGPNYKGEKKVVRVVFDPPLSGYEEVKPRLLGMKADADEALGTVRISLITLYHPSFIPHVIFARNRLF